MVAKRWTYPNRIGRPPLPADVAALIERMARDRPFAGDQHSVGELGGCCEHEPEGHTNC